MQELDVASRRRHLVGSELDLLDVLAAVGLGHVTPDRPRDAVEVAQAEADQHEGHGAEFVVGFEVVLLLLREAALLDALRAEPWLASPWFQKRHRSHVFDAELLLDQEAVPVGERGAARGSRDVPVSFDPRRRDYDFRQVERVMVQVGVPKVDAHDPMRALEEANQCF